MLRQSNAGLTAAAATGNATDADLQTLDPDTAASPAATPVAGKKEVDPPSFSGLLSASPEFPADSREENCLTETPLRKCCTPNWFLAALCTYVILQGLIASGLAAGSVSSLQTRYHIDSTMMGLINSFYDMVVSVAVPAVAFYGGRGHTPRYLGIGMFLVGLGSIISSFPQFMEGSYKFVNDRTLVCTSSTLQQNCLGSNDAVVAVLFIGQLVTALGASGLYSLGPAYLDKVYTRQQYPIVLGIFYAVTSLGPALGFIMSGAFLKIWVDGGEPPVSDLKPEDAEWVGAWWLPYLFCGIICSVLSVVLLMFPKYLPNTKHIRTENKRHARELERRLLRLQNEQFGSDDASVQAMEAHIDRKRDGWAQTKSMCRNPAYIFNILGQACDGFVVAALATFLPKITQSLFNISASNASFAVGLVAIPGAVGGAVVSGLLIKRFKVAPKTQAKLVILTQLFGLAFCAFIAFGCNTPTIVGVNRPFTNEPSFSIDNTCNMNCNCNPDKYNPICGSDGRTYYSSCFASCHNRTADLQQYFGCDCMADSLKEAKKGKCSDGCNSLGPFLVLLFLAMFFTFMTVVPAITVLMRSLPFQERPLGLAFQNLTYRWIGPIPSPPLMGVGIDKACILTAVSCGKELGDCLEYDTVALRRNIAVLIFIPKVVAICFYFFSLHFFTRVYPDENDAPDEKDKTAETLTPIAESSSAQ